MSAVEQLFQFNMDIICKLSVIVMLQNVYTSDYMLSQ